MPALTLTAIPDIPLIRQGDDLADIIISSLAKAQVDLADADILVITQKVVSKAEGRSVDLSTIAAGTEAIELARRSGKDPRLAELILAESNQVLRVRPGVVIVEHRLGFICANAGIDHSNVSSPEGGSQKNIYGMEKKDQKGEAWVLLLPVDPEKTAREIRATIESRTNRRIGVMIIDSHGRAWRLGTVGVCIGLSGVPAILDERGWQDLFGYTLEITVVGVADELAAAASLMMGQAAEATPVIHVRGFPYKLVDGSYKEILRAKKDDLFR